MIRAIIFDCFNVLIDGSHSHGGLIQAFPEYSKQISDINALADIGKISHRKRNKRLIKLLGSTNAIDGVVTFDAAQNKKLLLLISGLKEKYKISILSNAGNDFWRFVDKTELRKMFDDILLSYKVKMIKPDTAIYQLATKRLNVKPEECIFVDDSANNVAGAEAVGMRGILYKDFMQFQNDLNKILKEE